MGFTQRKLAKLSGVSKSTVAKIENGKAIPRVDTLVLLSRAMKMSPEELLRRFIDNEDI